MTPDAHGNFSGKRLVIFGCGYVGGEMARQAVGKGMQVTALTRNGARAEALREMGSEVVQADLAGSDWHESIEGGAEYVLNTVSSGGGGMAGYRHSYLDGMRSIMAWAGGGGRGPVGTWVYTSSTSVYPQDGGARVDEAATSEGVGERGEVLLAAEQVLRGGVDEAASGGVGGAREVYGRSFVLRLAGIYGPERHQLLEQVKGGDVAGRGEHHLNLSHRDDICAAIWAALGAPADVANEVFNVADDAPARKAEVVRWLAERLGVPMPTFTGLPAGGRRAVTPDRVIVNAKLKRVLGWRPRFPTFREGYENILSRATE